MRGTLVFVHGTGVRQQGYDLTMSAIREGCRRNGLDGITISGVAWGPKFGVPVDAVEKSLPPEAVTRDAFDTAAPDDADLDTAAWALLLDDPLFELRLVAESAEMEQAGVVVGGSLADQSAETALRQVQDRPPELSGTGLTPEELSAAAGRVIGSSELQGAALAVGDAADPDLIEVMARAVVATALAGHRLDAPGTEPPAALSGELRDELVAATVKVIAPEQVKGIGGWVKKKVIGFAAQRATAMAVDRRSSLQGASTPGVGDILHYQRRGGAIADVVAEGLTGHQRPIVAVGHSLGGIILVDVLSRDGAPDVDLLVTVGSQSPMFFAIDALGDLRPRGSNVPFSPWLNIYNRRDLLSFVTKGLWPTARGLTDVEVDSRVPFPQSHSAYWHVDRTYQLLRDAWPR
ncbi:MAG: alpha/beta fold hydrolase [Nitriliruptorales bacterium]|nr:alpha/beta fold hydrolase [Nitriliruptorales bacterium]